MSNSESEHERGVPALPARSTPHAAVRKATAPRYARDGQSNAGSVVTGMRRERPAPRVSNSTGQVPDEIFGVPRRNKIHSILTALPVLMLVAGLYYFYSGESAQNSGVPIAAESVSLDVVFDGVSVIRSGGDGRHYLWYDDDERRRGARIHARDVPALASLQRGDRLTIQLAPTVSGSSVLWAWHVVHDGNVLLETPPGGN